MYGIDLGTVANLFCCFFLCVLRCFSAIQSGFLDLCSIVNLSNDAVLGAKDIFFYQEADSTCVSSN